MCCARRRKTYGKKMSVERQISRRLGWATGVRTLSAADYFITATQSRLTRWCLINSFPLMGADLWRQDGVTQKGNEDGQRRPWA